MIVTYQPALATDGTIALPGSKSIAARALVSSAVCGGEWRFENLPDCDDTVAMRRLIAALRSTPSPSVSNPDCGPTEERTKEVSVGAAGTAFRFGTALAAASPGSDLTITGTPRLAERPIRPLTDALAAQGARFDFPESARSLPLRICGARLAGGEIEIDSTVSSQFISALMLVAPTAREDTLIRLTGGKTVSRPYIEMTAAVMRSFGAYTEVRDSEIRISSWGDRVPRSVSLPPASWGDRVPRSGSPASWGDRVPRSGSPALWTDRVPRSVPYYAIESDWSAASYFYEAAALLPAGAEIRIRRLTPPAESLQGDSRCAEIFRELGVETRFLPDGSAVLLSPESPLSPQPQHCVEAARPKCQKNPMILDMEDCPDLVPAVAVAAAMQGRPFRISGIDNLRVKECDRIAVIADHLRLLGRPVSTEGNILSFAPAPPSVSPVNSLPDSGCGGEADNSIMPKIDPHDDHRMAMAFAVAAIKAGPIDILDPGCVAKSFPDFFNQLEKIGIR